MTQDGTMIRSIEEITISAKLNMQDMIGKAMALGRDFADAKEVLGHGKFLPWLEKLGVSSSTANNYMKVAREITPGSRMAQLPYSKALALLAAPAEEREELAAQADDKSAAEIRRLIEERNRAAEAANAETTRADHAEEDAKRFNQENAGLRNRISVLENEANKQKQYVQALKEELEKEHGKLLFAENNRIEVEVAPADYDQLKRTQKDLMEAAAEAEERAAALEEELEALKNQGEERQNVAKTLRVAVTAFMADCQTLFMNPESLKRDQKKIETSVSLMEAWCSAMREALEKVVAADGAVVIE